MKNMNVTTHTPLVELEEYKTLSVRSKNACQQLEIVTLGDLLATPNTQILNSRNCGYRSIEELQIIKSKYSDVATGDSDIVLHAAIELDNRDARFMARAKEYVKEFCTTIPYDSAAVIYKLIDDLTLFLQFVCQPGDNVDEWFKNWLWKDYMRVAPYLRSFLYGLDKEIAAFHYIWEHSHERIEYLLTAIPSYIAHRLLRDCPPVVKINLEVDYKLKFEELPTRIRNIFRELEPFEVALDYLVRAKKIEINHFPGCGVLSHVQFQEFINCEGTHVEEVLSELDPSRRGEYYLQEYINRFLYLYPFLTAQEQGSLALNAIMNDPMPSFSVWHKFVMWTDDPVVSIQRDGYGLNEDHKMMSVHELAQKYNMSAVRVRHHLVRQFANCPMIEKIQGIVAATFTSTIVSEFDPKWKSLQKENNMHINVRDMMALFAIANNEYTLIQVPKSKESNYVLVKRVFGSDNFNDFMTVMWSNHYQKRYEDTEVDVEGALLEKLPHGLDRSEVHELAVAITYYYTQYYGIEAHDATHIVLKRNRVNKFKALEDILRDEGRPMRIEEIYNRYSDLYPNDLFKNLSSLHSYLLRNPKIASLGKRGQYALKEWTDLYFGNLKDYIPKVLASSDIPMTLEEITAEVQKVFPATNSRSISSLMHIVGPDVYQPYEGLRVGLAGKEYDQSVYERRIMNNRVTFEERFREFRAFVEVKQRIPYTNSDAYESSLDRWCRNVSGGKVDTTPEQKQALKHFIKENAALPQNGTEAKFREKCEELKEFVIETGKLPASKENNALYLWFRKAINKRGEWNDNRNTYFNALISWLHEYLKSDEAL